MAYAMAGQGNPGRIGGHEIQVSVRWGEGGHGQSVRGKPRLEPGVGFNFMSRSIDRLINNIK